MELDIANFTTREGKLCWGLLTRDDFPTYVLEKNATLMQRLMVETIDLEWLTKTEKTFNFRVEIVKKKHNAFSDSWTVSHLLYYLACGGISACLANLKTLLEFGLISFEQQTLSQMDGIFRMDFPNDAYLKTVCDRSPNVYTHVMNAEVSAQCKKKLLLLLCHVRKERKELFWMKDIFGVIAQFCCFVRVRIVIPKDF